MSDRVAGDEQPIVNIVGKLVTLGPISRDLVPLYTRWMNDFTTLRTLGVARVGPMTQEQEESWYADTAHNRGGGVLFVIREKATGVPIGNVSLNRIFESDRSAIFGIMIGEASARGRGYGTEAAHLMLDYAFTALGLHSVSLTCAEFNPAARRAYAKAGFRECGRVRENIWYAGRYWDTIYMDCLESEFSESVLKPIFTPEQERQ
jgi:RimJ/RimL family protein N-acetyltransferase